MTNKIFDLPQSKVAKRAYCLERKTGKGLALPDGVPPNWVLHHVNGMMSPDPIESMIDINFKPLKNEIGNHYYHMSAKFGVDDNLR